MRSIQLFFLILTAAAFAYGQSDSVRQDITGNSSSQMTATEPGLPDREVFEIPAAVEPDDRTPQVRAGYVRPDKRTRFRRYVRDMFGPAALGRTAVSAGISTWRNSPEEWGDGWEGFGRRVASGFGRNAIKQTAIYGLDEALKYDSRFYRSQKKDVGSRVANALISPVTARDRNGKRVLGVPRLVGTYTAGIVAGETWYPARYDYKDGLRNGSVSLGINAAVNLFREFVWK